MWKGGKCKNVGVEFGNDTVEMYICRYNFVYLWLQFSELITPIFLA
jgi:hypothetical protein